MTLNTPTGKEMAPEEILELIERHFLRALAALDEALLRLKEGEKDVSVANNTSFRPRPDKV